MSTTHIKSIVGVWTKTSNETSEHNYPEKLSFTENGLFQAIDKPESIFYIWDVGTYEFKGKSKILQKEYEMDMKASFFWASTLYLMKIHGIKFSKDKQDITFIDEHQSKIQYYKSN